MTKFIIRHTGVAGIEPALSVLETDVLPLNYAPSIRKQKVENRS